MKIKYRSPWKPTILGFGNISVSRKIIAR